MNKIKEYTEKNFVRVITKVIVSFKNSINEVEERRYIMLELNVDNQIINIQK